MKKLFLLIFFGLLFAYVPNVSADPVSDLEKCLRKGSSYSDCYRSEAMRYMELIEKQYEQYGKDAFFDNFKMNNAATNPEKFRRLLIMWKLYTQNYCNLVAYTASSVGDQVEAQNECLYNMTLRQLNETEAIESIKESDTY